MGLVTERAAGFRPPSENNATTTAITSGTNTAAIVVQSATNKAKKWWTGVCDQTWNVRFDDDGAGTVTNLGTVYPLVAGALYSFELNSQNTKFKAIASANANLLWWISSRE